MEKHLDPKVLMLAAQTVRQQGERSEGESYHLDGVTLNTGYDGYTITLSNALCSITLFFHNKIKADYQNLQDLERFYQALIYLTKDEP